ncbi:MAG: phosphoenolpyruvate carboxykinase (ATP), partial [Flavobacteriaceae bacterium]|nr:phosphoenolpyruvate carboxykinase (ATP) [Flavobacteriaceae bacterium]
ACFGAPFMPLHPTVYAEMLSTKMKETKVNVWLINTGWTGGAYGVGSRIKLKYTRAMITAAINGELGDLSGDNYHIHTVFGLAQVKHCPGVPDDILSQRQTWNDDEAFYKQAHKLADAFRANFEKFAEYANEEILAGGPPIINKP